MPLSPTREQRGIERFSAQLHHRLDPVDPFHQLGVYAAPGRQDGTRIRLQADSIVMPERAFTPQPEEFQGPAAVQEKVLVVDGRPTHAKACQFPVVGMLEQLPPAELDAAGGHRRVGRFDFAKQPRGALDANLSAVQPGTERAIPGAPSASGKEQAVELAVEPFQQREVEAVGANNFSRGDGTDLVMESNRRPASPMAPIRQARYPGQKVA